MTEDKRSTVPAFAVYGIEFVCWVSGKTGQYEWRSSCGRFVAGRDGHEFWALADSEPVRRRFSNLKAAMAGAIQSRQERAA